MGIGHLNLVQADEPGAQGTADHHRRRRHVQRRSRRWKAISTIPPRRLVAFEWRRTKVSRTRSTSRRCIPCGPTVGSFLFHAYNPALRGAARFQRQGAGDGLRRQQLVPLAPDDACPESSRAGARSRRSYAIVGRDWDRDAVAGSSRRCASRPISPIPRTCSRLGIELLPPIPVEARHPHDEPSGLQPGRGPADFPPLRAGQPAGCSRRRQRTRFRSSGSTRIRRARSTAIAPESSSSMSTRPTRSRMS